MGAQRGPSVNIISWNNGVGLTRDMNLLARGLREAGFSVHLTPIGRGKLRKWFRPAWRRAVHRWRGMRGEASQFDINIMLEHIRPEELPSARINLFVPNPEWCLPSDVSALPDVDGVLVKTRHAASIFRSLGASPAQIGFTSEDRYDPSIPRKRGFFHLAGRSSNKGTASLIELWRRHPEWPLLTIVQSRLTAGEPISGVDNIRHLVDYLGDEELRRLQNANRFHLCPSDTEGFGHYLVEAMSVAAVVITTDAPPMNELIDASRGWLVGYASTGEQHLATTYAFDERAMEQAIVSLISMPDEALDALGDQARRWYLDNDAGFSGRLAAALNPRLTA